MDIEKNFVLLILVLILITTIVGACWHYQVSKILAKQGTEDGCNMVNNSYYSNNTCYIGNGTYKYKVENTVFKVDKKQGFMDLFEAWIMTGKYPKFIGEE